MADAKQFARKTLRSWHERARLQAQLAGARLALHETPVFPNFMVIGAPRAATTWLHARLLDHPDIYLPKIKELHFFDEAPAEPLRQPLGLSLKRRFYFDVDDPVHRSWYALRFKPAQGRICGDITPVYCALSETRVRLIAEWMPDLKVIYILRDPVDRAWSGLRRTLWWRKAVQPKDLANSEGLRELALHPELLKLGDYARAIRTWEGCFGEEGILYLFYEDISENPRKELEKVCRFLGVSAEHVPPEARAGKRVNVAPASEIPQDIYAALVERYAAQRPFLEKKFNRDLSHWYR